LILANHANGCNSSWGYTNAGSDVISIGKRKIIRWSAAPNESYELQSSDISLPISKDLNYSFYKNANVYSNAYKDQLWFWDPTDGSCIWIYSLDKDLWVKFTGFSEIKEIFDLDGITAFYSGSDFFIFSDSLSADSDKSGKVIPIVAKFESGALNFSSLRKKKILDLNVCADLGEGKMLSSILYDTGETSHFSLSRLNGNSPTRIRLHSARFKTARICFSTHGECPQNVYYLRLCAKEK
jgi:hypothetical protein